MGEFRGWILSFWLISLSVPISVPPLHLEECTQTEGRLDCHPAGTQTEGGLGYHSFFKLLQEVNQARAQLEYELVQETKRLAERCKHKQAKQARRHARWKAQMINQTNATLQEALSQVSLMEAIKLLPWCVSAVIPFHYISGAATMAAQQDEGISIVSGPCPTVPEPEPSGSLVQDPSGGPTPPPATSPLPMSSLPDIPQQVLPCWGICLQTS